MKVTAANEELPLIAHTLAFSNDLLSLMYSIFFIGIYQIKPDSKLYYTSYYFWIKVQSCVVRFSL